MGRNEAWEAGNEKETNRKNNREEVGQTRDARRTEVKEGRRKN